MTAIYVEVEPDPEVILEWQANLKARALYEKGLSYPAISVVIDEYHGVKRTKEQWRNKLLAMGVERRAQRGLHPQASAKETA